MQLSVVKRPLEWYIQKYKQRDKIIIMAYKSGHYTQNEIGEYFSVSHTTVSRVVRQADVQLETWNRISSLVIKLTEINILMPIDLRTAHMC